VKRFNHKDCTGLKTERVIKTNTIEKGENQQNTTYFLKKRALNSVENSNQRALGAGGSNELPIKRESETSNSGIMSRYELCLLLCVMLNTNLTLLQPRARENERIRQLRNRAETLRVGIGLNLVQETEVLEVVDQNLLLDGNDNPIAAQPNTADGGSG